MCEKNKLGICGIFNSYTVKRNIVSWYSIVLATASFGVSLWLFFTKDLDFIYNILGKIADVFVSSVPDLLGFCIGGYAIIVAINGLDKMQPMVRPQPDKGKSYYHILSADFAFTLVVMCALLLLSYLMRIMVDFEFVAINDVVGKLVNLLFIALLLWMGTLIVIMLMTTVANLFSTSMIIQAAAIAAEKAPQQEKNNNTAVSVFKVRTWFGSFTVTCIEKKNK